MFCLSGVSRYFRCNNRYIIFRFSIFDKPTNVSYHLVNDFYRGKIALGGAEDAPFESIIAVNPPAGVDSLRKTIGVKDKQIPFR